MSFKFSVFSFKEEQRSSIFLKTEHLNLKTQ